MTIPAIKSFTNYNKYKTESGYTKQGELQQYMQNQNDCLAALTQAMLWQPETEYKIGKVITSPSMPTGVRAKVTTAGKTSDTEPTWTAAGTTVEDGTVAYTIESLDYTQLLTEAVKTLTTAIADAKKEALLEAHPVGSYYFSDDATNPGKLFGGTWEAIDPGYGLIAQGTATAEDGTKLTFTAGNKYGEFKHQLTVGELPKIEGSFPGLYTDSFQLDCSGCVDGVQGFTKSQHGTATGTWGFKISFGSDKYHNNVAPCIAAYLWKRTAQSVGELAAHKHSMQSYIGTDDQNFSGHLPNGIEANDSETLNVRYTNSEGNNEYHNNIPPVFAIYIWKRTVQSVGEMPSHSHILYGHDPNQTYTTHTDNADAPNSRDWTKAYRNWSNSLSSVLTQS